jgi:hypothetical protein
VGSGSADRSPPAPAFPTLGEREARSTTARGRSAGPAGPGGARQWDKVLPRTNANIPVGNLRELGTIVPEVREISDHVGLAIVVASHGASRSVALSGPVLAVFLGLLFVLGLAYYATLQLAAPGADGGPKST